jgi:hypothetical protein
VSNEVLTVEIINWDKFNPRKDFKTPTWFACSNGLFDNHEFFDFSHTEMLSWIYILSLASKKKSKVVTIHWSHLEKVGRIKQKEFLAAIQKLQRNQCVQLTTNHLYVAREVTSTDLYATQQDMTLQDKTEQDTQISFEASDLVKLWNGTCKSLSKVDRLTDKRKVHSTQRIKDNPDPSYWMQVAERIEASDFCRNAAPSSKGWKADFDWFIKPDTHIRVMEGKYDNRDGSKGLTLGERLAKRGELEAG